VPAEVAHLNNDPVGRARTLAEQPGRENVQVVSTDLMALPESVPQGDAVWLHLFYHDLHTALLQAKGATPADFNRAVPGRLKRGGFYVIPVREALTAGHCLQGGGSRVPDIPDQPRADGHADLDQRGPCSKLGGFQQRLR
jgi:predicted methyltransferase